MFYPIESRIHSLITIKRERLLERAGEVLVKTGDSVAAVDVIGRSHEYPHWHYVDVATFLNVAPDAVEPFLLKHPGDIVERDELLASRKGPSALFRRVCKSPATGRVAAIQNGRLLIEEQGESVEVRALLRGRVTSVMAGYGVVIETKGTLIKAAWSGGASTYGVLKLLAEKPTTPLQAQDIDIGSHGAVIVAGWCADVDALRQIEQIQARGAILGSIDAGLRQEAENLSVPIVITEGFGSIPMNAATFSLLQAHAGYEVALIRPEASQEEKAPEIIIPVSTEETPPAPERPSCIRAGQIVRLIGYPRLGAVGRVIEILDHQRRVESGALHSGVIVELDNQETLFVPWENVEPVS